jgi:hypothetical protein
LTYGAKSVHTAKEEQKSFIIIINVQGWAIWPVPSPELQLLSPSFLRSPQLFSFLVGCSGTILKGFGFVAFFAGVKASSFCIQKSFISG